MSPVPRMILKYEQLKNFNQKLQCQYNPRYRCLGPDIGAWLHTIKANAVGKIHTNYEASTLNNICLKLMRMQMDNNQLS